MKARFFILLFICLSAAVFGQDKDELSKGKVSYISSQNVYVKFDNTEGIHVGDTLFIVQEDKFQPVLKVTSLSSISVVGFPISKNALSVSGQIVAKKRIDIDGISNKSKSSTSVNDQAIHAAFKEKTVKDSKSRFDGRLAVSSYTNISDYASNQRFRYNLSLNAEHIGGSNLSAESYITFTHLISLPQAKASDWKGLTNAMKIYTLAVKYDLSKASTITFGRKINNNMANIGAVDGLQYEHTGENITFGAVAGSRPDYYDYGFTKYLLQYGAFVSHNTKNDNGYMQTTVAAFNQMNNLKTDRRFAYIQHSNSLLKNVDLFASFEFDLYTLVNMQPTNTFDLTSTYISLRVKPWNSLSMSLSYDARKNIYYYETFKSTLDSILDKETRQGFRFNTNWRPFKYFVWGANAGYNFPTTTLATSTLPARTTAASQNANTYLSYTQLPFNTIGTITVTALKSSYINSMWVYGASLSHDYLSGKVNAQIEYRKANYQYTNSLVPLSQDIAAVSLFWRIAKKLTISANFEGTLVSDKTKYGSLYINLSQRF